MEKSLEPQLDTQLIRKIMAYIRAEYNNGTINVDQSLYDDFDVDMNVGEFCLQSVLKSHVNRRSKKSNNK